MSYTFKEIYLLGNIDNVGNYSHYFTKNGDFMVIYIKDNDKLITRIVAVNDRDTRNLKEFHPKDYCEIFSPNDNVPKYLFPWDYVY